MKGPITELEMGPLWTNQQLSPARALPSRLR